MSRRFRTGKALAIGRTNLNEQLGLLYGIGCHHMLGSSPRRSIRYFGGSVALAARRVIELRWVAREPFSGRTPSANFREPPDERRAGCIGEPSVDRHRLGDRLQFSVPLAIAVGCSRTPRFDEASLRVQRCENWRAATARTTP